MAKTGDSYIVTLEKAHLEWGTHRYTGSRQQIYGEGYLQIPRQIAVKFSLYNSNYTGGDDVLGLNIFNCTSADGLFNGQLKAQGNAKRGDVYAKQFSGNNDLQALGSWYNAIGAQIGNKVKVRWISSTDIIIELMD